MWIKFIFDIFNARRLHGPERTVALEIVPNTVHSKIPLPYVYYENASQRLTWTQNDNNNSHTLAHFVAGAGLEHVANIPNPHFGNHQLQNKLDKTIAKTINNKNKLN